MALNAYEQQQSVDKFVGNTLGQVLTGYGGMNASANIISNLIANAPTKPAGSSYAVPSSSPRTSSGSGSGSSSSSSSGVSSSPRSKGSLDLSSILSQIQAGSGKVDPFINELRTMMGQYSKQSAMADASAIMEQRAALEREKQMPAIQRAVEGAGTSASSMQALLSQKLASDIARDSAAAGAEQVKSYGNIQTNLSGIMGQLITSGDPMSKLLTSILNTGLQTDASNYHAELQADASKYTADRGGNTLRMPSISYAGTTNPTFDSGAPSTLPAGSWYQNNFSTSTNGTSSTNTSRY